MSKIPLIANIIPITKLKILVTSKNGAQNSNATETKMSKIPFRMEMSAFSRLEKSIPVIGDIGVLWSILALKVSQALNIKLDFISYPQQTPNGKEMREWIVNNIDYIKMEKIKAWLNNNS